MSIAAGTRLGPYEIVSQIGAGGMGEVYKGKDTRLDRVVAVKVLPASMSGSAELRQRFEREARAVSQLSHPNICPLYDVGREGELDYIVMEFLEGETLAERLMKGPLPIDQVLQFGIQIADALDRAHKQGIVHRDLKPGNVMITRAGVKLLDFGLAKNFGPSIEGELSQLTSMPTRRLTGSPLTEQGTIMGTFQYMSPEQLEGKDADARTDIFGFGCVLFEMATAQKAFGGKSRASMIAAILEKDPPPVSSLAPLSPPALDRVVKTCLAKDPEDRFHTAHDVKLEMQWIVEGGSQAGVPVQVAVRRRTRERLWMISAALFGLTTLALAFAFLKGRPGPPRMIQSSILLPEKVLSDNNNGGCALSPDGTRLAFVGVDAERKQQIWVRPLSGNSAQPLQGTDDGAYPFWSPDGRFIAFFAGGKLKKIDAAGGPAETIVDAPNGRGGAWGADGSILYAPSFNSPVFRVASSGGTSAAVSKLSEADKESSHRFPAWLPDGKHFLYLIRTPNSASRVSGEESWIGIGSIDGAPGKRLVASDSQALYIPPGYLLREREGTLIAQPFDDGKLAMVGDGFPVAERVQFLQGTGNGNFTASSTGLLAHGVGENGGLTQLNWFDRSGRAIEKVGGLMDVSRPRLSPDGLRLAMDIVDSQSGNADIWIFDLARKTQSRFTFDAAFDAYPVWSPDGRYLAFQSNRKGNNDIYRKQTNGTGADEELWQTKQGKLPEDWTPDGRALLVQVRDPALTQGGGVIYTFDTTTRKETLYLRSEANIGEPRFSPDGKYVLYISPESGKNEVYVQSYPLGAGKWQISTNGGEDPVWSHDGKEIFFVENNQRLISVPVREGATLEVGNPAFLFEARFRGAFGQQYDVTADGQKFIIACEAETTGIVPIALVQNWLVGKLR